MPRKSKTDRALTRMANAMSSEQAIRLYEFIDPVPPAERAELDKLTDDQLLAELNKK